MTTLRSAAGRILRAAASGLGGSLLFAVSSVDASSVGGRSGGPAYLHIDAITINASDRNYDEWVNLLAFGDGSVRGPIAPAPENQYSALPARISDITITKQADKSSPKLMEACCRGLLLPAVQLDFLRSDPDSGAAGPRYASVELKNVFVSSYQFSASAGEPGGVPIEEVTLNFARMKLEYRDFDADGRLSGTMATTYDMRTGETTFESSGPGARPLFIEPVPTLVTKSGQAIAVDVGIGGGIPFDQVSLTASSSNPTLFPAGSLAVDGGGAVRTLTLSPAPEQSGQATIRLRAVGGDFTVDSFFDVFVEIATGNIQLSNSTVTEHSPAGTVVGQLTVDPADPTWDPLFDLAQTRGQFRLEGDLLVVNDPLMLDFEISPRPQVVVRVRDEFGNVRGVSQLTIEVQNLIEGGFDQWRADHFSDAQLLDPAVSGPRSDPNGDDFDNLTAYALGLEPVGESSPEGIPRLSVIEEEGQVYLTLTIHRRSSDPSLRVVPQLWTGGQNDGRWSEGGAHFILIGLTPISPDYEEVEFRTAIPVEDIDRQLVRLQVSR